MHLMICPMNEPDAFDKLPDALGSEPKHVINCLMQEALSLIHVIISPMQEDLSLMHVIICLMQENLSLMYVINCLMQEDFSLMHVIIPSCKRI